MSKVPKYILEKCINSHRLNCEYDEWEKMSLAFLRGTIDSSYVKIDGIKGSILCMNKRSENYLQLSEEKKKLVELLIKHNKVVDIVLFTLFQWLGTSVGSGEVGKLLDRIRKRKSP